jgi:hypothetical protein
MAQSDGDARFFDEEKALNRKIGASTNKNGRRSLVLFLQHSHLVFESPPIKSHFT